MNPYSQKEIDTLIKMRDNGSSFEEISETLNRSAIALKFKYRSVTKKKPKQKRKYTKRQ